VFQTEVDSILKDGTQDFTFKVLNHKHTFQAKSGAERDGWILALETAVAEAKAKKEEITTSTTYTETLEKHKQSM